MNEEWTSFHPIAELVRAEDLERADAILDVRTRRVLAARKSAMPIQPYDGRRFLEVDSLGRVIPSVPQFVDVRKQKEIAEALKRTVQICLACPDCYTPNLRGCCGEEWTEDYCPKFRSAADRNRAVADWVSGKPGCDRWPQQAKG